MAPKPHPLDQILGTQAAVRVLRVLSPGGEHAPPRIARETKISRPAVREAIIRLEKEGVVERVGDGRNVLYRISLNHPLAKRIVKLFKTEAKRGTLAGLLLLCASSLVAQGTVSAPKPADLIVTGGHIYTVDDTRPAAQAFAVRDGIFAFVGSTSEAMTLKGPNTRVIDLHGATVLPGLADAHGHLTELGETLHEADLAGSLSYEEVIERTKKHAGAVPKGEWIKGHGWDQNRWASKQFPTSDALTRAFPDNPVVLERIDGHALLANARAMEAAKITAATKDPSGGRIVRDASGNPTGVFVDNAQDLIGRAVPPPTDAQLEQAISAAIADVHR
ncbi:MAG TPA: amidohydrolase family protein, partial [Gemmatimonadaceae bacterium]|nr:amidohydrolase family protein [Gemmatimonadaceae bacterium]